MKSSNRDSNFEIFSRLPKHQNDCRKQNPNANVSRCRFNSAHHIPNEDLTRHESECESRVAYEQILAGNH